MLFSQIKQSRRYGTRKCIVFHGLFPVVRPGCGYLKKAKKILLKHRYIDISIV